ncbi:phage major tail tube protein [Agrobacterium genomosp. 2]|uniref:Phage tail tube protein FII n=1 Tax=Agrobacterium genomosp. 2 str. CFBP 5494 TaxID=1183436 RepID=A0A9W5F2F7_9HYPH|nr:phage major tail tube protein [Agrobacterium genomosp. 2]CUW99284.1 Phage tail tube protein FII [Agrobacterium genomosp. 2 str. CFBP 5494]
MTLRIIRGFTLNVNDNINLALDIETLKLPALEEITETFQPGGSDMELDITGLGIKALTMPFKLKSHTPETLALFGGPAGVRQNWTGKKLVISEEDGTEHEHSIDVTGRLSKVEGESMAGGKATGYDHEIKSIWSYTEYWDGRVMHRFSFKKGGWDIWNYQAINSTRRSILFS